MTNFTLSPMRENVHTHTARCHHAKGTEREYIEAAIDRGLAVLGFADHGPQIFPEGYVSGIRMLPEELPEYVRTLTELRQEYKNHIDIRIGLELEYYPACFDETVAWIRKCGVEFLILGQHWIGNEIGETHTFHPSDDPARLTAYVDQSLDGLRTGLFSYAAHPDAFRFVGNPAVYREQMTRFCREAKRLNVPLEINLQGVMENRPYPREDFWQIAAETGNRVVLGIDAHQPHVIRDEQPYLDAHKLCRAWGITPEEHIELRDIR